jgi:hypothetical protein
VLPVRHISKNELGGPCAKLASGNHTSSCENASRGLPNLVDWGETWVMPAERPPGIREGRP